MKLRRLKELALKMQAERAFWYLENGVCSTLEEALERADNSDVLYDLQTEELKLGW